MSIESTGNTYTRYREWASVELTAEPQISVVIPAYNEEVRILPTVGAVAAYMCARGEPWELIVADDGSYDSTVPLLEGLSFPNMKVLRAERNAGKGNAVRRGMSVARGHYVLFLDADQSTPIEQFDRMLRYVVDGGFDVAVGSRAARGATVSSKSRLRHILSWGLQVLVRVFFGIRIRDTQCGFKLFKADVAKDLFGRQVIDGFSFDLELIYLAGRLGYRVAEVPVDWIDAPGSKVEELKVVIGFLGDLLRIRVSDLRGVYSDRHRRPLVDPSVTAPRTPSDRSSAA
jgi:dolichyl-phosphate beta-glucosyltransferase